MLKSSLLSAAIGAAFTSQVDPIRDFFLGGGTYSEVKPPGRKKRKVKQKIQKASRRRNR